MKILHTVEWYWPSVGGAQEVVRQISERLARKGHSVTVATSKVAGRPKGPAKGVKIEEFAISGNKVSGFRGEVEIYRDFLCGGDFDIMMNYAAQQWSTDLAFPLLERLPYRKVLAPCGFSGLYTKKYEPYFHALPERLRFYDRLVFHSHTYQDMHFARTHGLEFASVITNGASREEFDGVEQTFRQRYGIPEKIPLLLTVSNHTRLKGHGLVLEAFRLARTGPAVLVIIGKPMGRLSCLPLCRLRRSLIESFTIGKKKVFLLDVTRAETLAAYKAADLFLFGSRLECSPLVLFEAVASGTPFISTACGNAEEIAAWTEAGVIIPTRRNSNGMVFAEAHAMASAMETLLGDREKRKSMAEKGMNVWRERFTWDHIADQYERLYETLIEKGN